MGGPSCEVLLEEPPGEAALRAIDAFLERSADTLVRTRKGRVWSLWIHGRPFDVVCPRSSPEIELNAGCNSDEDWALLRWLALSLAEMLNGIAGEPIK